MIVENTGKPIGFASLLQQTSSFPAAILRRIVRRPKRHWQVHRFRQYVLNLSKVVAEPVFVKIGANDGLTGDPCSDILLANENWKGLLIEPVPYCFDRLKSNFKDSRRFRLEQEAIGASVGQLSFYYVDAKAKENIPDMPTWFDQIGSFDRNHIVKHMNGRLEPFIIECKVRVRPLSDALVRNGIKEVHLLHVDTEGADYEVLKSIDLTSVTPLAIFIEYRHLPLAQQSEMLELLRTHRYSVRDCGGDYFALHKIANERLQRTSQNQPQAEARAFS